VLSRVVYKKQRGRRLATVLATVALISGSLFVASTALAVHDAGVFELDANAVNEAAPGVDWEAIFAEANTPPDGCTGATACSFTHEADNETIFTGGGSKDDLDIPKWKHKNGSVPPKDDLADGFAARYTVAGYDPDGPGPLTAPSDIIYFGADRTANDGDAFMGFWFFQDNVTALTDGTGKFGPGVHVDGDILIITDFSGGGDDVSLAVYRWNGPDGAIPGEGAINHTLDELIPFGSADCLTQGSNDPACATVNDAPITSPWPFVDKANSTDIRAGEFVEGGINLTFLGLADECFSSFLAETRSSTSVNATLKDFIGGQFDVCEATLSTAPSVGAGATVTPGTPVTDIATVVGNNPAKTPTGTVTFSLCGPTALDSTALCTTGGTSAGTGTLSGSGGTATATSSAVNTVASPLAPGRWCFRADWPGDINYIGALTHAGTGNSECFIVAKIPTGTVTSPSPGTITLAAVNAGGTVTDTAVVTGTEAGGDPTGTVNFFVCTPAQLTPANTGVCSIGGSAVLPADVPLVSDGVAGTFTSSATSGGVGSSVITGVGLYCFRAVYGGDLNYLGSDDSRANECFTVTDSSSGSTAQNWRPNDSATFSSAGGTALAGIVTFSLYDSLDCTGTVLYTEARNIATQNDGTGSVSSRTVKTTNDGTAVDDYLASATGNFSWSAVFASTNAVTGSTAPCESTALTLDNDITAP